MNKANDFIRKLKLLREEDFIWLIYFFIVIFALIANAFEENYLFTKNTRARNTGRKINIILLTVAFIIYFYYVVVAIDDINLLKYDYTSSNNNISYAKKQKIALERLITTLVFLVGGALSLYTEFDDNSGDVDLAIF